MNTIRELKQQEKYNNMLKRKNKEIERLNKVLQTAIDICNNRQKEIVRLNNIINELEKYIHNELILDFYNDDMPCELIVNKMENMIKNLKGE